MSKLRKREKEFMGELDKAKTLLKRSKVILAFRKRPTRVDSRKLEIAMLAVGFDPCEDDQHCEDCEQMDQRNCLLKVRERFLKHRELQEDDELCDVLLDLMK